MPTMTNHRILPEVPAVRLELVADVTPVQPAGFLQLVRRQLVARGPDGSKSEPFVYDEVDRKAIDAVVVAAYYRDEAGVPIVYLRSATRPPVVMRPLRRQPFPELASHLGLWELVAGLVEEEESSPSGIVDCARRELDEELGFEVSPEHVKPLGQSTLPAPGVLSERHYYFCVEVDPTKKHSPSHDGSALEQLGKVIDVPLSDALRACDSGEIEDAKTELGLRRLAQLLEQRA